LKKKKTNIRRNFLPQNKIENNFWVWDGLFEPYQGYMSFVALV